MVSESRDEIHYLNGKEYQRRFTDWTDGVGYELIVGSADHHRSRTRAGSPVEARAGPRRDSFQLAENTGIVWLRPDRGHRS